MSIDLSALRRRLHRYPELSNQEFQTSQFIRDLFSEHFDPDEILQLGGHGLAFVFNGREPGPTVMLRADMDALPIHEVNTFEHRSQNEGVSHKCGHDGHMTILAGVAEKLAENRPQCGRVVLVYQPAEETGDGARAIVEDPEFSRVRPDYVFALHNVPGYPEHQIQCRTGVFSTAVRSMIVHFRGKTAHSAKPYMGINPGMAVAELIRHGEKVYNNAPPGAVCALVYTEMGERSYGVAAGHAEIAFQLRAYTDSELQDLWDQMSNKAHELGEQYGLGIDFSRGEEFVANTNDAEAVEIIRQAAEDTGLIYHDMPEPNPWGEDFGTFNANFTGAMFTLGAGEDRPDLHNPDYDFNDDIIPTGVNMFTHLITRALALPRRQNASGQAA